MIYLSQISLQRMGVTMRKLLSLFLALLLCLSLVCCNADKDESRKKESNGKNNYYSQTDAVSSEGPILYKVEKNGTTVYLFGSIHVGTDEMHPLPDYVQDAFDESDALAVEFDITENTSITDVKIAMKAMYTDGTKISDHISKELYNKCVSIIKDKGDYNTMVDMYKPIMWKNIISNYMYEEYGYDSSKGIDITLINAAKDDDKEIIDIESMNFQMNMLLSFSEEYLVGRV